MLANPAFADEGHPSSEPAATTHADSQLNDSPSATVQSTLTTGGPGTEMTKIINRLGMGSDCGRCKALAAEMDQRGVEG